MFAFTQPDFAAMEQHKLQLFQQSLARSLYEQYHCTHYCPDPNRLEILVMQSVSQGQKAGFETQRELRVFAELSLLLGHNFFGDPMLPWVIDILNKPGQTTWSMLSHLQKRARFHQEMTLGSIENFPITAYQRLRSQYLPLLQQPGLSVEQQQALLRQLLPRKAGSLTHECWNRLLHKSGSLNGILNQSEVITLAFLLGFEFDTNPLYPWSQSTVTTPPAIWNHLDHLFGQGFTS